MSLGVNARCSCKRLQKSLLGHHSGRCRRLSRAQRQSIAALSLADLAPHGLSTARRARRRERGHAHTWRNEARAIGWLPAHVCMHTHNSLQVCQCMTGCATVCHLSHALR